MLAGMSQLTQKVPSLSSGKNSEPRREAATMDNANAPTAINITWRGLFSAHSSTGRYTRLHQVSRRLSACGKPLRSIQ